MPEYQLTKKFMRARVASWFVRLLCVAAITAGLLGLGATYQIHLDYPDMSISFIDYVPPAILLVLGLLFWASVSIEFRNHRRMLFACIDQMLKHHPLPWMFFKDDDAHTIIVDSAQGAVCMFENTWDGLEFVRLAREQAELAGGQLIEMELPHPSPN
jgi:hypothetical protein